MPRGLRKEIEAGSSAVGFRATGRLSNSGCPVRARDRGQYVIAGTFVLVLLLLSAVFVANLAVSTAVERQQGFDDHGQSMLATISSIERWTSETLSVVNRDPSITTERDRTEAVEQELEATTAGIGRAKSDRATIIDGSVYSTADGIRIVQNEPAPLMANTSEPVHLVEGAKVVRQVVTELDVGSETGATVILDGSVAGRSDSVTVTVRRVTGDGGDGQSPVKSETVVTVDGSDTCRTESVESVRIDFIAGYVDGVACKGYPTFDRITAIAIDSDTEVTGTYSIVFRGGEQHVGDDVEIRAAGPPPESTPEPVAHHVVYAAAVEVAVATDEGSVLTTITVPSGEHSDSPRGE